MTNDVTKTGIQNPDNIAANPSEGFAESPIAPIVDLKASPQFVSIPSSRTGAISSYQNYLFGGSASGAKPAWSDSMQGRAAIRVLSRGVVGAAFFTVGGRIARNQLNNYSRHEWEWDSRKPLQALAKGFDVTFGKAIEVISYGIADTHGMKGSAATAIRQRAARESTIFRTKTYYHTHDGKLDGNEPMNGRSLGAEMVAVSFDFAMMSVGDAMIRNFVQAIDPNVVKPWIVGEDGKAVEPGKKGRFDAGKFAKSLAGSTWRILSKNQGEDWAAALPYVYQMKLQRQFLTNAWNRRFDGSKLAFDHNWNGGAYEVNNKGQVIGDYQLPGAIDLHARFVGYNWYTLMFREAYDGLFGGFQKWKDSGFKMHFTQHHDPLHAAVNAVGGSARYIAKSFIKANLYMNPAVVPFWLIRVPQSKWRAGMINTEVGPTTNALGSTNTFTEEALMTQERMARDGLHLPMSGVISRMIHQSPFTGINFNYQTVRRMPTNGRGVSLWGNKVQETLHFGDESTIRNPMVDLKSPYDPKVYQHYPTNTFFDRFEKRFSQLENGVGKICYDLGTVSTKAVFKLSKDNPIRKFISQRDGYLDNHGPNWQRHTDQAGENFIRTYIDSMLAYTPYMYTKAELGMRVDDRPGAGKLGRMDQAIYGLMDNVSRFDIGATGQSVKHIWGLATNFEKEVKAHEGDVVVDTHHRMGDGSITPVRDTHRDIAPKAPATTIQTEGVRRSESVPLKRTHGDDNHDDRDSAGIQDRNWAEGVAGRNLGAQFQTPPQTRQ